MDFIEFPPDIGHRDQAHMNIIKNNLPEINSYFSAYAVSEQGFTATIFRISFEIYKMYVFLFKEFVIFLLVLPVKNTWALVFL